MTDEKDKGAMLLPCPFCGSTETTAQVRADGYCDDRRLIFAFCNRCKAQTAKSSWHIDDIANGTQHAMRNWNARATPSPQKPGEVDLEGLKREVTELENPYPTTSPWHGVIYQDRCKVIDHLEKTGRLNAVPEGCYIPYEVEEHGIKWRLLGGHYGTTEHIGMTLNTYTSPKEPAGAEKGNK